MHAAIWSAVAQMHGAALHRSYRFRASRGWRGVVGLAKFHRLPLSGILW